ncbi:MAG: O-antigen ligase family protein [Candidatus Rokuibacteriota bacterium]
MPLTTSGRYGASPAAGNVVLLGIVIVVVAVALSRGLTSVSFSAAAGALAAVTLFGLVFVRTDFGIYLVIFSMLLSPEFGSGGGKLAEGRAGVTLRSEDFILLVIGLSWLAKTAVNKELGLVAKTPLNRPIIVYIAANALATMLGYVTGNVGISGFFYVLKYVEYFFIYYMVVNNVRDRDHAWRLIVAAFVTAAVVSVIGLAQVPSGQRVSAPFEGEEGEPNTFGGYLLFMMAMASMLALETRRLRVRVMGLALVALMSVPFLFTLSRASYLGVVPAALAIWRLTTKRRFMTGLLLLALICAPIAAYTMPSAITSRILYTFEPEKGQATVRLGKVGFDPSTSARLISVRAAFEGWLRRPILGFGVTGFGFMDSQFARVLVETGALGFLAFCWLVWAAIGAGRAAAAVVGDPEDRAIATGFVAGTIGLLFHSLGSNTFIIVRVMEPFWLFTGIVVMLASFASEPAGAARPAR